MTTFGYTWTNVDIFYFAIVVLYPYKNKPSGYIINIFVNTGFSRKLKVWFSILLLVATNHHTIIHWSFHSHHIVIIQSLHSSTPTHRLTLQWLKTIPYHNSLSIIGNAMIGIAEGYVGPEQFVCHICSNTVLTQQH